MSRICWDPRPPEAWFRRGPRVDVKVGPVSRLTYAQLRRIDDVFEVEVPNLLHLRDYLCNGEEHLLARDVEPFVAKAISGVLEAGGIPFKVTPRASETRTGNEGVRNNFMKDL